MTVRGQALAVALVFAACGEAVEVRARSDDQGARLEGCNARVSLAHARGQWGALCLTQDKVEVLPSVEVSCEESLVLTPLDDRLRPTRPASLQLDRQPCQPGTRFAIVGTEKGFGAVWSHTGEESTEIRYAHFDVTTGKLAGTRTLRSVPAALGGQSAGALSADALLGSRLAATYRSGKVVVAARDRGAIHVVALGARGHGPARPEPVLSVPFDDSRGMPAAFAGRFDDLSFAAWAEGGGDPYQGAVRFAFGRAGQPIRSEGTVLPLGADDHGNVELQVVAHGAETWLFVLAGKAVWRQRFDGDGQAMGSPQRLAVEDDNLYNLHAAVEGEDCVVQYARGNFDVKAYSCRSGASTSVADGFASSMHCDGRACVRAYSGGTLRPFSFP